MSTLLVAGVFIDTLVRRARGEAAAAEASANTMTLAAEIAHRLAALGDWKEARAALCEAASQVAGADGVALWEPSTDGGKLHVSAASGDAPDRSEIALKGSSAGVVRAFSATEALSSAGALDDPPLEEFSASRTPLGVRWQPILYERRAIAVLAFYWHAAEHAQSPGAATVADLLAAEAATTLERVSLLVRLERLAQTDDLTGLPNRRAWQDQLPRELERARRSGAPICAAMLDLDHFKQFNDLAGHIAGDRLLREVAMAWSSQLRPSDLLARYGGEEFAIALPGCAEAEALEVIERVRAATPGGQECSAGIALWDGAETAAKLLERADGALYEAKYRGRNQIRIAPMRSSLSAR
jgi:diguanylate cyclase (GGDEF)-like protein